MTAPADKPWLRLAACYQTGDPRFFGTETERAEVVLEFCAGCPVQQECGEYRVDNQMRYGVWGGEHGEGNWGAMTRRGEG